MSPRSLSLTLLLLFSASSLDAAPPKRQRAAEKNRPAQAISLELEHEDFGDEHDPWTLAALEYSHRFSFGSVIGRVNRARRFDRSGTQLEVDAYPRLGKGMYLYTNAGVSGDRIFPRQRVGAELFKSLPNSYEASAGFRHMRFGSSNVTLVTGSVAKYLGDYYFAARPYISQRPAGTSMSGQFAVRNYFATADDYASLTLSFGSSPTDEIDPESVNRRQSWSVRAGAQRALWRNFIVGVRAGYRDEEFRSGSHRRGWMVSTSFERRF